MSAWAHFTILCATIGACQSSSLSCENTDVTQQHGAALLQAARMSKSLTGAADEEVADPLGPTDYKKAKESCCLRTMAEFITKLAIERGYKICNPGFGPGLAHWHTCDGKGKTSTFEELRDNIDESRNDPCSVITEEDVCPTLDSTKCPPFQPKVTDLPPCKPCSMKKAVEFDFKKALRDGNLPHNNLAGVGPTAKLDKNGEVVKKIVLKEIGETKAGDVFHMVVLEAPGTTSNYVSKQKKNDKTDVMEDQPATANGVKMGPPRVNIGMWGPEGEITLKFKIKDTNWEDLALEEFHFTLYDIDGDEEITVQGFSEYAIDKDTDLKVTEQPGGNKVTFSNNVKGNNEGKATFSNGKTEFDATARKAAVMMIFKDTSGFKINFKKTNTDGWLSSMVFVGRNDLEDDYCEA
jgi:hypothetical protein